MSASKQNKLAALTEKQAAEKKQARKLKVYSIAFFAALVLMIGVLIFTAVTNSGIIERNTTALKVNDHKISTVDLNYYFVESVNDWYSNYGSYAGLFGLDVTKPLDEQNYTADTTWANYFVDQAKDSARSTYALYDAAMADGFKLTEEQQKNLDANIDAIDLYASTYGFADGNAYVRAMYGKGASTKSLKAHNEIGAIASAYYAAHQDSLSYTDADYREAEAENYGKYSTYSYTTYALNASTFYEGGTEDAEGNKTYSDAEQAAGLKKAEAAAKNIAEAATSVEAMNEAIKALDIGTTTASTQTDVLYSKVDAALQEWISDSSRTAGDVTVMDITSTDADGNKVTVGYTVVYFESTNDNVYPLVNVRHVLVPMEGGTENEDGTTTYSDADYTNTEATAQNLLNQWDGTEDGFASLANLHSSDNGSNTNGGLYENVVPGQMVPSFNDWCFDSTRKPGDTGIVKSDYGYHIMYFVGNSDTTYRDFLIRSELISEDMSSWYDSLLEGVNVETINTSKVNGHLVLNANANNG